ncbi:hypothetical protein [Paenibacillus soyae]|uniref:Uncharacterized protein n=1 Tax=Paenibacillus soyae TaxID=2969249 RepID=A0A9X2MVB2_9BACL|nr:hypothetical protein [Paenibacillus soyae]MCR2807716.1 hypothetical protein [Paenibacillus soyae]
MQTPCRKCSGTGYLPQYNHIDGGKCFPCSGTGYISSQSAEIIPSSYSEDQFHKTIIMKEKQEELALLRSLMKETFKKLDDVFHQLNTLQSNHSEFGSTNEYTEYIIKSKALENKKREYQKQINEIQNQVEAIQRNFD